MAPIFNIILGGLQLENLVGTVVPDDLNVAAVRRDRETGDGIEVGDQVGRASGAGVHVDDECFGSRCRAGASRDGGKGQIVGIEYGTGPCLVGEGAGGETSAGGDVRDGRMSSREGVGTGINEDRLDGGGREVDGCQTKLLLEGGEKGICHGLSPVI